MGGRLIAAALCGVSLLALAAGFAASPADAATPLIRQFFPPRDNPKGANRDPADPAAPFLMRADEVIYDRDNEIVTATGNVELTQGERVVTADVVSFNQRTQIVTASGHLVMMEPSGEVIFGDFAEIKDDMRDAVIQNIRALLIDNSRIAAAAGQRVDGNKKELSRGVFSPCDLCESDPTRAPLWQVKGVRVLHDEVEREVIYEDATLEMFGVPVFYTPYFSHPDPSVRRRSGFLAPSAGTSSNLGAFSSLPYYGVISPSSDFTVEPKYFTSEGAMLSGEYRQKFDQGSLRLAGSGIEGRRVNDGVITSDRTTRGFFAGEGRYEFDDNWRGGFDVARQTDRTFLRRFKVGDTFQAHGLVGIPDLLTSDAYVEGFFGRSYASVSNYAFQSLRAGDQAKTLAKVHPYGQYSFVGQKDSLGGTFKSDSNVLSLSRDVGTDSNRLTNFSGYYLPVTTPGGAVITFATTMEGSGYYVHDLDVGVPGRPYSGTSYTVHPQAAASIRYPLINRMDNTSIAIEPIAQIVAGPRGDNPKKIPNEDSLGFDLDDSNLFSLRRFSGYDRVASGSRIDYGVTAGIYGINGGSTTAMVGQSVRADKDPIYPVNAGVTDQLSDIVGRVGVRPLKFIDLSYGFRLDHETGSTNRNEISTTLQQGRTTFALSYLYFNKPPPDTTTAAHIESVATTLVTPLSEFWSTYGQYDYDIQAQESRLARGGVFYRDECFGLIISVEHDFTTDRDISKGTTVGVRLGFKYLGDIGGG